VNLPFVKRLWWGHSTSLEIVFRATSSSIPLISFSKVTLHKEFRVTGFFTDFRKCLFIKATPDPDFKYLSKVNAPLLVRNVQ